eukprot:6402379-Amphidinium_carterae.1
MAHTDESAAVVFPKQSYASGSTVEEKVLSLESLTYRSFVCDLSRRAHLEHVQASIARARLLVVILPGTVTAAGTNKDRRRVASALALSSEIVQSGGVFVLAVPDQYRPFVPHELKVLEAMGTHKAGKIDMCRLDVQEDGVRVKKRFRVHCVSKTKYDFRSMFLRCNCEA